MKKRLAVIIEINVYTCFFSSRLHLNVCLYLLDALDCELGDAYSFQTIRCHCSKSASAPFCPHIFTHSVL